MTESIIQPEPFPKDFCMFEIDSNTSSVSFWLIVVSAFEFE